MFEKLKQLIYKLECWSFRRYSTVKSRHLPHTWCDTDTLMEYTLIEIVQRFNEGEGSQKGLPCVFYDDMKEWRPKDEVELYEQLSQEQKDEMIAWYANNTNKDASMYDHLYKNKRGEITTYRMEIERVIKWMNWYWDESWKESPWQQGVQDYKKTFEWKQKLEKELVDNLTSLIEIRRNLWT